jgi:hypothetical protein
MVKFIEIRRMLPNNNIMQSLLKVLAFFQDRALVFHQTTLVSKAQIY